LHSPRQYFVFSFMAASFHRLPSHSYASSSQVAEAGRSSKLELSSSSHGLEQFNQMLISDFRLYHFEGLPQHLS
jgi:hypothetical protein